MSDAAKPEGGAKKGGKLPLIIGIVVLVLALVVGKTVLGGSKKEEPAKKTSKSKKKKHKSSDEEESAHAKTDSHGKPIAAEEEEEEEEASEPAGEFVALEPEFTVNLTGEASRYLRTSISVGLRKGFTKTQFEHHVAPVRDRVITILSSKEFKVLNTPAGKRKLKRELLEKLNEVFHEEKEDPIVEVCFTAFATQ